MAIPTSLRPVLPDFLPGTLTLVPGTRDDYRSLAAFHYLPGGPSTRAAVWAIRYAEVNATRRVAAVAVLSWPTACHRTRYAALNLTGLSFGQRLAWINANLRTISRVIVHPQFRALGLASVLIRWVCSNCNTRYVEATARMGRVHPMFVKAGMTPIAVKAGDAAYYLLDRGAVSDE